MLLPDEIVLPKGSSSVFVSTNITYLLNNLDVEQLVICGGLTDQCVESAVRDACDAGFLLPTSLPEALAALRADEVLVEVLGTDFVEWYGLVKRAELADVAANTARFAATGMDHDAAVQEAWNSLYFEFV